VNNIGFIRRNAIAPYAFPESVDGGFYQFGGYDVCEWMSNQLGGSVTGNLLKCRVDICEHSPPVNGEDKV